MESHAPESTVMGVAVGSLSCMSELLNKLFFVGLPLTICAKFLLSVTGQAGLTPVEAPEKTSAQSSTGTWALKRESPQHCTVKRTRMSPHSPEGPPHPND